MSLPNQKKVYIEPVIRTIAGFIIITGLAIDYFFPHTDFYFMLLAFVGLNFFQSGITGFCGLEKILKNGFKLRSEMDEILLLGEQVGHAKADRENIQTLNLLQEAILELDTEGRITRITDGYSKILNCSCSDAQSCSECRCDVSCYGNLFLDYIHDDDREDLKNKFYELHKENSLPINIQFRIRDFTLREKIIEGKFVYFSSADKKNEGIRGILRDSTESILQEKKILHLSLHDSLTGLPNRILFTDRLEQALNNSRRNGANLALMMVDIDAFNNINELHGHHIGDSFLADIAEILRENMREMDTIARWGSDEFIVLMNDFTSVDDMKKIIAGFYQRIIEKAMSRFPELNFTMSAGISFFPGDASSSEQLLRFAARAMEKAKLRSRNSFSFYSDINGNGAINGESGIAVKLISSIQNNDIRVFFQPIVDAKNNKIVSVEALARWHDDEFGWINPVMFIQIAENIGLIQQLGSKIFEFAFDRYLERSDFRKKISLALNVSYKQLISPKFELNMVELLERYGIEPERITLEIGEGLGMLALGRARECLKLLSEFGCRISLDNFGTGFSSIPTLQELPLKELKIDGIFTKRIHERDGGIILKSLIDMGQAMGLKIVCKSVEDEKTAVKLKELGADYLQGNYFMKPQADIFVPDAGVISPHLN